MGVYIKYDPRADLLAVSFRRSHPGARSRDIGGHRFLESDTDGPVSVEFLFASEGVDLTDVPYADEIERALSSLHGLTGKVTRQASA